MEMIRYDDIKRHQHARHNIEGALIPLDRHKLLNPFYRWIPCEESTAPHRPSVLFICTWSNTAKIYLNFLDQLLFADSWTFHIAIVTSRPKDIVQGRGNVNTVWSAEAMKLGQTLLPSQHLTFDGYSGGLHRGSEFQGDSSRSANVTNPSGRRKVEVVIHYTSFSPCGKETSSSKPRGDQLSHNLNVCPMTGFLISSIESSQNPICE